MVFAVWQQSFAFLVVQHIVFLQATHNRKGLREEKICIWPWQFFPLVVGFCVCKSSSFAGLWTDSFFPSPFSLPFGTKTQKLRKGISQATSIKWVDVADLNWPVPFGSHTTQFFITQRLPKNWKEKGGNALKTQVDGLFWEDGISHCF